MVLKILLVTVSILTILVLFSFLHRKRLEAKQRKDLKSVFGDMGIAKPNIEFGISYGWPTFEIIFRNKKEMEIAKANKLTDEFEFLITKYYGPKFEVKKSIFFTYEGWSYSINDSASPAQE